ncbi:MAG: cysteine-rich KTR domain-containing protein [Pseudoflavonifractor sp.]|nr:cysteine-rich KTR domain-containing protein [Pseudoflavonifractor sp.]
MCPVCGKGKVLRLETETTAHALPVYCRRCGRESIVNIDAPEPVSDETSA